MLHVLSAGAAKAVVEKLAAQFTSQTGVKIDATFGAVGAMQDKRKEGAPCDLIILTAAQIAAMVDTGDAVAATAMPIGAVFTGVGVRAGDVMPDISTAPALREAMLAADGIFFPDPVKATAGIHFAKVLAQLGIAEQIAARLMPYPAGAIAMRAMAESTLPRAIGCTQITEILYTPGVSLVAALPKEFELVTVYSVGVCTSAAKNIFAIRFAMLLGGAETAGMRIDAGFEATA
jgi:molybdate transport system substrate-binding protein